MHTETILKIISLELGIFEQENIQLTQQDLTRQDFTRQDEDIPLT